MGLLIKKYDRNFYTSVIWYLEKHGYNNIGAGGYRTAFATKASPQHSVIKVPQCPDGLEHNICEAFVYRKYRNRPDKNHIVYAPCRLLSNGCLLMSFISFVPYADLPHWAHYIDVYQVGKLRDRFVAYDGGCDTSESDNIEALKWAGVEGR